jgi:hypothetical protein
MRHEIRRLLDLNSNLKPDASSLVVPIIPTIGMMEAAADARDVFQPGDRLGEWLLPEAEVGEGVDLVDPVLAAQHGRPRAYELQVMAEAWAGCIAGLREWSRRRGIEGSSAFIEAWFRPELDRCPDRGWPENHEGVTEGHTGFVSEYAALRPFTHDAMRIPHCDLAYLVPAPTRCSSIMAMRGGQREPLMKYYALGLDDVIDMDRLPFIPGYSVEHRFDDEQRHRILAAAAWRAAAASVRAIEDDQKSMRMPLPPRADSVYLKRLAEHVPGISRRIANFSNEEPHGGLSFTTRTSSMRVHANGNTLEVSYEGEDGRRMHSSGWDFRLPSTSEFLTNMVRELVSESGGEVDVRVVRDPL